MTREAPPPRSIHFDIGRITLHGYGAADRDRFETALRIALAELAASQAELAEPTGGGWPGAGNRFILRLGAGAIPAGASPERAARVIAARVFGAVAGPGQLADPGQVASPGGTAGPGGTASPSGTASPGGGRNV
jgi:hypothetical protein